MTLTHEEAYDEMMGHIRTGWLASPVTSSIAMAWDDRRFDRPGEDTVGLPLPWARSSIAHIASERQGISSNSLWQETAIATIQVFTAFNGGRAISNRILQVAANLFRGITSAELTIVEVGPPIRIGQDAAYFAANMPCRFYYFQENSQT